MSGRARVAINGFGRTGRQAFRAIWLKHRDSLEVIAVGVQDPRNAAAAAHLLKYDSNYGHFRLAVAVADGCLQVDGQCIPLVAARTPADLPWSDLGASVVIEATGAHTSGGGAAGHLEAGADKVIITAPSDDADISIVYGVNEDDYDPARHRIVASESGTANALAVVVKVLDGSFDVRGALMTAVSAYTNSQKLVDATDQDLRRARAAPLSIVPTSTRAATAVARYFPNLQGKLGGYAVRVPVPTVSILELTAQLAGPVSAAAVNDAYRAAAAGPLGRVLAISDEPLVSSDFVGDSHSAVLDTLVTVAIGPMVKIGAWYDNEWGYSNRVADIAALVARRSGGAAPPAPAATQPTPTV